MTSRIPCSVTIFLFCASTALSQEANVISAVTLRTAAEKALKPIQRSQVAAIKKQECASCHHQLLPELAFKWARERGVAYDEKIAEGVTTSTFAMMQDLDSVVHGDMYIDLQFDAWLLLVAKAAGVEPNLFTAASAQFVARNQAADGGWLTIDQRPPQAHSRFNSTAASVFAIEQYLPERLKDEKAKRIAAARKWLIATPAITTEDAAFQLLGLHWSGADAPTRAKVVARLLDEQRPDGGWAQFKGMPSDAYSTGEVLMALHEGGTIATADPRYQKGLKYLLDTQERDGSWQIATRLHPPAPISPPFFQSDFPFKEGRKRDQFISIMGTTYAAIALMQAIPHDPKLVRKPLALNVAPAENAPWIRVALTGSAKELEKLLHDGLDPNSRTKAGTSVLMLAAHDLDKAKLLTSQRKIDIHARSSFGYDALMVASRYGQNAEVVKLLLAKGAKPNADASVKIKHDATPFFFAVAAHDVEAARALIAAKAKTNVKMKLLGQLNTDPALYATMSGDIAMLAMMLEKKAFDPNRVYPDPDENMSLLIWAVINNQVEVAELLIKAGARPNHMDLLGMRPIHYAASIDFGDTKMVETLLKAGADPMLKTEKETVSDGRLRGTKVGLTAVELARSYGHTAIAEKMGASNCAEVPLPSGNVGTTYRRNQGPLVRFGRRFLQ